MIYAQIHTYNGNQQTIAARFDQPDSTWVAYDVPDATWLYLSGGAIAVYTQAEIDAQSVAAAKGQLRKDALTQLNKVTGPSGQVIRAVAAGIALNSVWITYIQDLRAIANGTDTASTALPTQPAFIAGT